MIDIKKKGSILEVCLNRPKLRNALNLKGYQEFSEALDQASEDEEIKLVLVYGAEGHFTSGNDLKDFMEKPPQSKDSPVLGFLRRLANFEKVMIAAVEGWAVGIGTTMLLHCDLVIAGESARFQLPFIDLGLCPEGASSYLLPRIAGYKNAADWLLTGRVIPAAEAQQAGLINRQVQDGNVIEQAREMAATIAKKPSQGLLSTKKLLKNDKSELLKEVIRLEAQEFTNLLQTPVAQAAFKAFLNK